MGVSGMIDHDKFAAEFGVILKEKMLEAAQPILDKAMKDVEYELRKSLGGFVIGFIESSYSVERYGSEIRISVHDKTK